jgi:hypothetical protein
VKKELRPVHDAVSCDVCGRTILKGERAEWYLAPGGHRRQVCDLCAVRAQHHGWIRESGAGDLPARMPRNEPRRGMLGRMRKRRPAPRAGEDEARLAEQEATFGAGNGAEPDEHPAEEPAPPPRPRSRPQNPRHVRAVPTNAQVKVERALELFNQSEHPRTIAGIARTLGEPWVSAVPLDDLPAEVALVVAWELSWYRFQIDLGAARDPVTLVGKGHELDELDESLREWNASAVSDGRIGVGVRSER